MRDPRSSSDPTGTPVEPRRFDSEAAAGKAPSQRAMRRVLMISETFPPYNLSGSQRPFQFAKHLPEFGYLPCVISSEPRPGDPVDAAPLSQLDERIRLERIHRLRPRFASFARRLIRPVMTGVCAARRAIAGSAMPARLGAEPTGPKAPVVLSSSMPLHRRAWHTLTWLFNFHLDLALPMLQRALELHRREPVDLVWVSAPSSHNLVVGYCAARLLRRPLVVDLRDPWTYGSSWRPCSRVMAAVERRWAQTILRAASRTVLTSPLTLAVMQERFPGEAASKMCTITNGHAGEVNAAPLRSAPDDCFLISYVGSFIPPRRPDLLLDALARVCRDPEIARDLRLQCVGGLAGHEQTIASLGLRETVIDVGRVSHAESVRYMRGADVNLVVQSIGSDPDVIAGKTFECLAARRPVLGIVAPAGGDAWLLRETGAGSVASFHDPDAVADEIRRLWRCWRDGRLEKSVEAVALERYSRRHLSGELAALFDDVLKAGQGGWS